MTTHPTGGKLTPAQRKALESARDYGDAKHHLRGRSAFGGWELTRSVLLRRGLIDPYTDNITAAGRAALGAKS